MLDERPRILLIDDGEAYAQAIVEQMSEFCLVDPGGDTPGRASDGPAALSFLDARADDVDVVLDHGLGVVLGHRLAQGLFAADCATELRLEQATRRLAGTEARHADLFRNALERSVDGDIECFFVDFNRELHPVVVEGLHSALHRVAA